MNSISLIEGSLERPNLHLIFVSTTNYTYHAKDTYLLPIPNTSSGIDILLQLLDDLLLGRSTSNHTRSIDLWWLTFLERLIESSACKVSSILHLWLLKRRRRVSQKQQKKINLPPTLQNPASIFGMTSFKCVLFHPSQFHQNLSLVQSLLTL